MKVIQKGLFRVCFHPIAMLNICTTCISWEIGSYNTQMSLHMNICTFVAILSRNPQYNFPKMRGSQRPFGTFPKIHPIWKRASSLILVVRGWAKQETEYSGHFNELLKTDRLSYSSIVQLVPLGWNFYLTDIVCFYRVIQRDCRL